MAPICALDNQAQWQASAQGLGARDLAMHVVLPELDGRLIGTAISFKGLAWRSERSQSDVVCYQAHEPGMAHVAEMARKWCDLANKSNESKRIALILANYPTRDGRIGNGVGLDTPGAALNILRALQAEGYPVDSLPDSGTALIHSLLGGVTNDLDGLDLRPCAQSLALDDYLAFFHRLPAANQQAVRERWGEPQDDPMFRSGRMMVAGLRYGLTFVGIQPARGYQLDAAAVYHDPDLVPPHGYIAFYAWLRTAFAHAPTVKYDKPGQLCYGCFAQPLQHELLGYLQLQSKRERAALNQSKRVALDRAERSNDHCSTTTVHREGRQQQGRQQPHDDGDRGRLSR